MGARGLPPGLKLEIVLSDDGQHVPVGELTMNVNGEASAQIRVPMSGMHEGICFDGGPCEYRPVGLGRHNLSLSYSWYDLTGALTIPVELTRARSGVPYDVTITGECGPIRTELDGRTWVAAAPDMFDPPGPEDLVSLQGTLTVDSQNRATFMATDGRSGRFVAEDTRYYC